MPTSPGGPAVTNTSSPPSQGGPAVTNTSSPTSPGGPAVTNTSSPTSQGGPAVTNTPQPTSPGGSADTNTTPLSQGGLADINTTPLSQGGPADINTIFPGQPVPNNTIFPGRSRNPNLGGNYTSTSTQERSQASLNESAKQEQEEKKNKIREKIEEIRKNADVEYTELSKKYKAAKAANNTEEMNKISTTIDEVFARTSKALDEIQTLSDNDETPIPIKVVKSVFNFCLNKIKLVFIIQPD